jgi:hypothetical protein
VLFGQLVGGFSGWHDDLGRQRVGTLLVQ